MRISDWSSDVCSSDLPRAEGRVIAMAGPMNIFDIAGRAMSAQLVRLNATASNMANAGTVTGDAKSASRAIKPVFETVTGGPRIATVKVDQVVQSEPAPVKRHAPGPPLDDAKCDVWEDSVASR